MVTISSTSELRCLLLLKILFNDLESTGCLHQLLMIISASVNLIGVHWSHGALALDGWLAMTCVWSPSVEIQSLIALQLQLGFGESIRVLVKWLTECDWMDDSQLSQTHSWFWIAPLGIWISHWFKLFLNIGIVTIHCLLNIQRGNQLRFWLTPFHELFVDYSLMRLMLYS